MNKAAQESSSIPRALRKYNDRLGHIVELKSQITMIEQPAKDAFVLAKKLAENAASLTAPLYEQIAQEQEAIAGSMKKDRRLLIRRYVIKTKHGKIVSLPNGELAMQIVPKKVFLPQDTQWVIQQLLRIRGGKRHLRVKHEVDLDSLKSATPRMLEWIGARVHRTEWLYIQPTGDLKRTNIATRRYPEVKESD